MKRIGLAALIASTIGPVQSILGWVISGSLWPGYDPISKTISDLAADDSPVQSIQTSFFFLGATLTVIGAISARTLALPGGPELFLPRISFHDELIQKSPVPHRLQARANELALGCPDAESCIPAIELHTHRGDPGPGVRHPRVCAGRPGQPEPAGVGSAGPDGGEPVSGGVSCRGWRKPRGRFRSPGNEQRPPSGELRPAGAMSDHAPARPGSA